MMVTAIRGAMLKVAQAAPRPHRHRGTVRHGSPAGLRPHRARAHLAGGVGVPKSVRMGVATTLAAVRCGAGLRVAQAAPLPRSRQAMLAQHGYNAVQHRASA